MDYKKFFKIDLTWWSKWRKKKTKICFDVFKKMIRYTDLRFCVKNLNFEKWITKKLIKSCLTWFKKCCENLRFPLANLRSRTKNDYLTKSCDVILLWASRSEQNHITKKSKIIIDMNSSKIASSLTQEDKWSFVTQEDRLTV